MYKVNAVWECLCEAARTAQHYCVGGKVIERGRDERSKSTSINFSFNPALNVARHPVHTLHCTHSLPTTITLSASTARWLMPIQSRREYHDLPWPPTFSSPQRGRGQLQSKFQMQQWPRYHTPFLKNLELDDHIDECLAVLPHANDISGWVPVSSRLRLLVKAEGQHRLGPEAKLVRASRAGWSRSAHLAAWTRWHRYACCSACLLWAVDTAAIAPLVLQPLPQHHAEPGATFPPCRGLS